MPGQHASSLQLIALSEHNQHLTGNPTESNFTVYSGEPDATVLRMKHAVRTNYALDNERIDLDGNAYLGQRTVTEVKKQADLLRSLYVCVDLPGLRAKDPDGDDPFYIDRLGFKMIDRIELRIGNQVIESLDGDYLDIVAALEGETRRATLSQLIFNYKNDADRIAASSIAQRLYVPIPFFFTSSMLNALPLAGIPYHKVQIEMVLKPLSDLVEHYANAEIRQSIDLIGQSRKGKSEDDELSTQPTNRDTSVFLECGFVYLDEAEHQHVQEADNSFLITQVQRLSKPVTNGYKQEIRLPFNHPVRELVWTVKDAQPEIADGLMIPDPVASVMMRLNNHPRYNMNGGSPVEGRYFRTVQPYEMHGEVPADSDDQFYYCYSFDLDPQSPSPGGSLNCSRVDHAVMEFEFEQQYTAGEFVLFARNWNVVHIKDQKVSLAYAS